MKQTLSLLIVATVFLFAVSSMAANQVVVIPLNSSSPVYVAGKEITSLPVTISSSGLYFITKDLNCASGSHGISITADNVTLDLMGFSLIGPGGTGDYDGVNLNGRSDVEIKNGTIKSFPRNGIYDQYVSGRGNKIINIQVLNNSVSGAVLHGNAHIIEQCTAGNNGARGLQAGKGSIISNNTCFNNTELGIFASAGTTVINNSCFENGVGIYSQLGSTIVGNTCHNNTSFGIRVQGDCLVNQNTSTGNSPNFADIGVNSTRSGNHGF